jgi:hypothetical protein
MDLKKVNSFFEKFWLVVGIGTTIYGIYYVYRFGLELQLGLQGNIKYLLFPLVAFFFYGLRRSMRIRMEKQESDA